MQVAGKSNNDTWRLSRFLSNFAAGGRVIVIVTMPEHEPYNVGGRKRLARNMK